MIKKIIITVLGLFLLIGLHASINSFLIKNDIIAIILMPLWSAVYITYTYLMARKYLNL